MGQKVVNAGPCEYCDSEKKAVFYTGLYPQDEELMEVHCNTCRSSWEPDGTPRALPSAEKLMQLGVFQNVLLKGLAYSLQANGEWFKKSTM
jgi:hypothetical protein